MNSISKFFSLFVLPMCAQMRMDLSKALCKLFASSHSVCGVFYALKKCAYLIYLIKAAWIFIRAPFIICVLPLCCANQIKLTLFRTIHADTRAVSFCFAFLPHAPRIHFDVSGAQLVSFLCCSLLVCGERQKSKTTNKRTLKHICVCVYLNEIYLILLSIAPRLSIYAVE